MPDPVWFWQRIVSPHMAGLAAALAATGRAVTYIAEVEMSADRAAQGWQAPALGKAHLSLAPTPEAVREAVREAPADSIHICQGLRGNGLVGEAQRALAMRGIRQWVIMETVNDSGWRGAFKRLEYYRLIRQWDSRIEGALANGHMTSHWLADRGMPADRIFPFAYFLPDSPVEATLSHDPDRPFRFLFAGQFIERKRIDLLIDALAKLSDTAFELATIGSGPLEEALRASAEKKLPGRANWLGRRPIGEIPALMAGADCLVLPSRHDGWGAVVSEALAAGTPAICSDACGAAGVVRASGVGGVFPAGNVEALAALLRQVMAAGRQTLNRRATLADWGQCLGAKAGARYLDAILSYAADAAPAAPPIAPWVSREMVYGGHHKHER
ncbi:MAG: glycosyltransferase [Brucella intermedia]